MRYLWGRLIACQFGQAISLSYKRYQPDQAFHQISRKPNCVTRAPLPELRVARTPSPPTEFGLFGLLNTLKKSTLNRTATLSLTFTNLNNDASWNHCRTPGMYWFRQG